MGTTWNANIGIELARTTRDGLMISKFSRKDRRFIRWIEKRCKLRKEQLEIPKTNLRLICADLNLLRRIMKNEDVSQSMVNLRTTSSRRGSVINAEERARTSRSRFSFRGE